MNSSSKKLWFILIAALAYEDAAGAKTYHYAYGQGYKELKEPKALVLVPGIYSDLDKRLGGEISLLSGLVGVVVGAERRGLYLEGELVLGPVSFGLGPRVERGRLSAQTTLALPVFFVFPYWRRYKSYDNNKSEEVHEFGLMLKVPLSFEQQPPKSPNPVDEVI